MALIPVEDGKGQITWIWEAPDVCPAGHPNGTRMEWRTCPGCWRSGLAWECSRPDCRAWAMDWEHSCNAPLNLGRGYPR